MTDPRRPIITEDEHELFHIQLVEDDNGEADEFTQWLLGDDYYDENQPTQEVSH